MTNTDDIIRLAEERLKELRAELRPLLEEQRTLEVMLAARADGATRGARTTGASVSKPSGLGERSGGRKTARSRAETQEQAVQLMRDHPAMPVKAIAAELGITANTVYRFMRPLRTAGVIDGKGTASKPWRVDESKPLPSLG